MCPNGVEWVNIGDVSYISDYVSAGSFASLRENVTYRTEPDYAVLVRIADFSSNFDESKFIYIDQHAYNFLSKSNLQPGDIIMSNVGSCGLTFRCPDLNKKMSLAPNAIVIRTSNNSYFYHWLTSKKGQSDIQRITTKSAMPKFNKTQFKQLQLPLPPLAIQTRIVEILDHFTNLTANLTAELNLRRKQFEHYREKLLSLDGVEGVEWKTLGEVFDTRNGYTPSKANSKFWKDGNIPWYRMEDIRDKGRFLSDSYLHITESAIKGKGLFKANSFILATTATIGEHALLIADSLANQRFTNLSIRKSLSDKLDVMFMYYYMFVVDDFCKSHTNKSGFASVDMGALKKMPIPLPPLATQHSIVSVLDKFTALIENIEKELALRQKQYEYYREELLRFERTTF